MMAAAQQHRKKRSLAIRKTDAMNHAERQNGTVLDQIWMQGDPSSFLNLSTSENQTKSENNQNLGVIEEDENLNYLEKDPLIEKSDGDKISNIKIKQKTEEKENERISQQPSEFREEENSVVLRSPLAFEAVFQYYANGVVHKPPELCPSAFSAELEFWRVPTSYIGACCSDSVSPLERLLESSKEDKVDDTSFEKLRFGQFRRRMWTFLERPGSSMQVIEYVSSGNQTIMLPNGTEIIQEDIEPIRIEHPIFVFTERVCIAFFTIEYLLRLFAAPRKLRFVLKPLNLVDLLAIMPFYLELMLTLMGVDDKKLRDLRWAFLVVRILRVLRVIRIIKLGRFSSGLQTFGMTLQRWCIVTMTTVGYGDVVPATTMGKIIASAAIMSGVLVLGQ
uniref:Uncharacterized protein n=1 Tax=Meloidogyne javanica TaxID=6303 RepID=A0A915M4W4_MELJA